MVALIVYAILLLLLVVLYWIQIYNIRILPAKQLFEWHFRLNYGIVWQSIIISWFLKEYKIIHIIVKFICTINTVIIMIYWPLSEPLCRIFLLDKVRWELPEHFQLLIRRLLFEFRDPWTRVGPTDFSSLRKHLQTKSWIMIWTSLMIVFIIFFTNCITVLLSQCDHTSISINLILFGLLSDTESAKNYIDCNYIKPNKIGSMEIEGRHTAIVGPEFL